VSGIVTNPTDNLLTEHELLVVGALAQMLKVPYTSNFGSAAFARDRREQTDMLADATSTQVIILHRLETRKQINGDKT
jgi:hypothetical protein